MSGPALPGAFESANIWRHPDVYEIENRAVDPEGLIESAMRRLGDWEGRIFLDLGCGSGFHLRRWAEGPHAAAQVYGVEPHRALARLAARRAGTLANVRVLQGTAQNTGLPDASVDVMQARWAYFFGPGCEPGLVELDRVMRRGGTAFVIDNDATTSTFGAWFRRGYPAIDPLAVERFWSTRGWTREPITMRWLFESRSDLEAVVRIEFDPATADLVLGAHAGLEVDYAVNLWWRRF